MKYFIADSHFCHESVIEFDKRPFSSVEEMNRQMIARWNKAVKKPADEVFILGDFLFRGTGEEANRILKKLRGRKFLIRGNHDHFLEDENFDVSLLNG